MDFDFEIIDDESVKITLYTGIAESVSVPDEIQGLPVTLIGDLAFSNCQSLVNVTIPCSVEYIGENAFQECNNLKNVSISNDTKIGTHAFPHSVNISRRIFGDYEFDIINGKSISITKYTGNAEELMVPDDIQNLPVTSIGDSAFSQRFNFNITNIMLPDRLESIGFGAFSHCYKIAKIKFPNTLISIGDLAFWECISLKNIVIPNSVTNIGNKAFKNCSNLESVILPRQTELGKYVFPRTTKIIYRGTGAKRIDGEFNIDEIFP